MPRGGAPIYGPTLVSKLSVHGWPKGIGRGYRVPHIIPVGPDPGHPRDGRRRPAAPNPLKSGRGSLLIAER